MNTLPESLRNHRVEAEQIDSVCIGEVHWAPAKSVWFLGMLAGAVVGGLATISVGAVLLFVATTGCVLLFGHSLGSHRKLIHGSYQCPKWLEYFFVYCGVQVGLAGPLGLLRQHELRDYAQRLSKCHDYFRHRRAFWQDAWWQLNCELALANPPRIAIESRIADDRFLRFLERTWMAQQMLWAVLFYLWGGWAFVFWGVCARVTAGVFGHWLIGYFAHNHGAMQYEVRGAAVQGRNIPWTSLLTMGESWHNNHHAFPGSARLGLQAQEWDPGWWVLCGLERIGLVWNLRLPADLAPRAELVPLDATSKTASSRHADPIASGPALVRAWRLTRSHQPEISPLLSWPGKRLSRSTMTWLVGQRVVVHQHPELARLSLSVNGERAIGAVALCIAIGRRNPWLRTMIAALLPVAVLIECCPARAI